MLKKSLPCAMLMLIVCSGAAFADGWAPGTYASNTGSITNTRHNLSLSFITPDFFTNTMNYYRNQYGEVCVYCHTPHGASATIPQAPLWNRTNPGNTYTLYNIPLQSGQTPTQPGINSLTCLSCHDGTVAIDSIINMPGSGKYSAAQETGQSEAFLDSWGVNDPLWQDHTTLNSNPSVPKMADNNGCFTCHSAIVGLAPNPYSYLAFDAFLIGTDLTDDHPVGVQLPDTNIYDFNAPTGTNPSMKFYDTNGNNRADSNEIRFYNSGEGYEVECASCHDPHGVPHPGAGGWLVPSFLRRTNWGSQVCLTCHVK